MESLSDGKVKSVLIGQPEDLGGICELLNRQEPSELCTELRRLVKAWQMSGPNLAEMFKDDTILAARTKHGRTLLVPTRTGKAHLHWRPNPPDFNPRSWKDHALTHFMDLIVNPRWHMLGGPCARCGKYYVKKTARQKAYCSRRCGSVATAAATTRKRREEAHAEKVREAQAAVDELTKIRTRLPWKHWVSARTKVTVKWLTRAVNRGELRMPVKYQALCP